MSNSEKILTLKKLKELYKIYLNQSGTNNMINCMHDDSGGHPDYHCDQHDNTPRQMIKRPIIKNGIH